MPWPRAQPPWKGILSKVLSTEPQQLPKILGLGEEKLDTYDERVHSTKTGIRMLLPLSPFHMLLFYWMWLGLDQWASLQI